MRKFLLTILTLVMSIMIVSFDYHWKGNISIANELNRLATENYYNLYKIDITPTIQGIRLNKVIFEDRVSKIFTISFKIDDTEYSLVATCPVTAVNIDQCYGIQDNYFRHKLRQKMIEEVVKKIDKLGMHKYIEIINSGALPDFMMYYGLDYNKFLYNDNIILDKGFEIIFNDSYMKENSEYENEIYNLGKDIFDSKLANKINFVLYSGKNVTQYTFSKENKNFKAIVESKENWEDHRR